MSFHAKEVAKKGVPIDTSGWRYILQIETSKAVLRAFTKNQQRIREGFLILVSVLVSSFLTVIITQRLSDLIVQFVTEPWLVIISILEFVAVLALWIFLWLATSYLIDLFTLPLQAHFTVKAASLDIKNVHLGKLRHTIEASISETFGPTFSQQGQILLTVAATHRGLEKSLQLVSDHSGKI